MEIGMCEECRGRTYNEECKNPECAMFVPSPCPPTVKSVRPACSCGEMYEGRPCAPDCEAQME